MGEIIYEKHFHKETIEEIERERIDFVEAFGEDADYFTPRDPGLSFAQTH